MKSCDIAKLFCDNILEDRNLWKVKEQKENGSMGEVLGVKSNQSFLIKFGIAIEKCFYQYAYERGGEIMSSKTRFKQIDLFFKFENKSYYFEVKNNVNLDTEKTLAVINKINNSRAYVDVAGCLTFRCATRSLSKKYAKPNLVEYIWGYNDFFKIFKDELNAEEYIYIIDAVRRKMIDEAII